jgi:membrane-bound lytic murein transglycosylase D
MVSPVKLLLAVILFMLGAASLPTREQAQPASAQDDGLPSVPLEKWLNDNIDPDVLQALSQLDGERVQQVFSELQQAMNGTNIYRLGALRETATQLIPLLQKYEETAPYADWLQARLDYLETAAELEREMTAAGTNRNVTLPLSAPTLKMQRQVWTRALDKRPWPPLAQSYVPELKAVFVSEHAPPELVWVAEVESSFNKNARSPAGAAGMFQLMPQTAGEEQLSLWPWDERLQPEKSARAAARYLRALHAHYDDWELALAAYNAGEGRVDKLLKQEHVRTFEAIARRLPAETQMYVPKVEATMRKREGVELEDLKMPKG